MPSESLVPAAVAESLRWAPPVCALSRGVKAATELQGQALAPGDKIVMLLASANRDEDQWDEPETYVMDRFAGNEEAQYGAKARLLSFGHGRHLCTGSLLARLEMIEGMHLLLDRFDGADFTDGFHRRRASYSGRRSTYRSAPTLPACSSLARWRRSAPTGKTVPTDPRRRLGR